jgi:hypothetical protein
MDASENRLFFTEVVFAHFPALYVYLQENSVKVIDTIDAWQGTLRDITTQEALSVVYRWTRDELPRPSHLQYSDFALHLRGVVMRDRADQKKGVLIESIKSRESDSASYSHVSLRPFMKRIWDSGDAFKSGLITREQHDENTKLVLSDHAAEYRKANLR